MSHCHTDRHSVTLVTHDFFITTLTSGKANHNQTDLQSPVANPGLEVIKSLRENYIDDYTYPHRQFNVGCLAWFEERFDSPNVRSDATFLSASFPFSRTFSKVDSLCDVIFTRPSLL